MRYPNSDPDENTWLIEETGGTPQGLEDIVLLCDLDQVEPMRDRHPHIRAFPLVFATSELTMDEIMALMGINDPQDDRFYTKQVRKGLAGMSAPTLLAIKNRIPFMNLSTANVQRVEARLDLLSDHTCDEYPMRRLRRPGRMIVLDPRSPYRSFDDVMTVNAMGMSVLIRRSPDQDFNTLLRVDVSKEFLEHRACSALLQMCFRKRRHLGLTAEVATQNPEAVSPEIIGNADLISVGHLESQEALNHIGRSKDAFRGVSAKRTAQLEPGHAIVWASEILSLGPPLPENNLLEVLVRAQNCLHGGKGHAAADKEDDGPGILAVDPARDGAKAPAGDGGDGEKK
jgi:hypothetical protein